MGSTETLFETSTVGVEHTIFMMRTKGFANIFPDALIAQVHTEGDAIIGEQQQMWFARCERPCSVDFSGEDFADQRLTILRVFLKLEVCTKIGNLLSLHGGT